MWHPGQSGDGLGVFLVVGNVGDVGGCAVAYGINEGGVFLLQQVVVVVSLPIERSDEFHELNVVVA